jgi:hypothetical protein
MPDAPLLADAEADRLDLPTIREHVRRLIESDRGRAQMVKFFKQWLRVTELDSMADTPEDFPKLASAEQAQSLRDEFRAFIESVVFEEQGTFGDLLTQNVAFVDKHTAALYGAESDSDTLVALDLDRTQRGGVLTLASVMAVHSSSSEIERDKPIRRGLVVKNQFLCEEIGLPSGIDPNAAAAEVMDDVPNFEELTTREQLELIMNQDELCVSCHTTFMPYGYLWSNFDALGQYNTHFGDRPLDSAVTDLFVNGNVGAYAGVMDFLPQLVDGEQSRLCFGENFVRYATGYAKGNLVTYLTEALAPITVDSDLNIVEFFQATFATQELYVREGN